MFASMTDYGGCDADFANFNCLPIPLLVLSSQKRVLFANEALLRLLAWSHSSFMSKNHHSVDNDVTSPIGFSLSRLGIILSQEEFERANDLDSMLSGLGNSYSDIAMMDASSCVDNEQGNGSNNAKGYDEPCFNHNFWPDDDWYSYPEVSVKVDITRRCPISRPTFQAMVSARLWQIDGNQCFLLTFSKPATVPGSSGSHSKPYIASNSTDEKSIRARHLDRMKLAVFENADFPLFLFSADESIYYPNKQGRQMTRRLDEQYMLRSGYQVLTELEVWDENYTKRLDASEYPVIKLVRSRKKFKDEKYGYCPVPEERMRLDVSGDCLYDEENGEFLGGVVWCRDVTNYTDITAQQKEEIDRGFENKLDYMPNLLWTADSNGLADYFSKRWYEYTGAGKTGLARNGWQHTIHPDDLPGLERTWLRSIETGCDCAVESRYRRFDGVYRWHLIRATPQHDQDGNILKWHGACADIHDIVLKRIEASHLKQQMISVLSHADVNLFAVNADRRITMLEGAIRWSRQPSYEKSALIGHCVGEVLEGNLTQIPVQTELLSRIDKILKGDSTMEILEHDVDDRSYRSRIIADLKCNSEGGNCVVQGVLGLSIDITDVRARHALEFENTQLVANEHAAKEANRLKSQFLANVSHELRTPIAGVLGMADLLIETPLEEEQREYARGIQQSADSLLTIVNDILDFSKIEAGRFDIEEVQFDLSAVMDDLAKLMSYAAQRKGLALDYKTTIRHGEVILGDPGRLRQVLLNLLTNAMKFTSAGTITFSVSSAQFAEELRYEFVVQDTGIGIEDAMMRKLFRPFSQGDASTARLYGGTGLGLTICKELAKLMHGHITLKSTPHVGTTATFSVPFRRPLSIRQSDEANLNQLTRVPSSTIKRERSISDVDSRPMRRGSPIVSEGLKLVHEKDSRKARAATHCLVVEDNSVNRTIAVKWITQLGFSVAAVWNGQEALEYLRHSCASTPRPDIILMDCQMPVMDGYQATQELRDLELSYGIQKIPVIALTASAIKGDREKCKAAGMDDYITKPVTKKNLEETLLKWTLKKPDKIIAS